MPAAAGINDTQLWKQAQTLTHVEHCAHYKHLPNDNVDWQLCQHVANRSEAFVFVQSSLSSSQYGERREGRHSNSHSYYGNELSCLTATNFTDFQQVLSVSNHGNTTFSGTQTWMYVCT